MKILKLLSVFFLLAFLLSSCECGCGPPPPLPPPSGNVFIYFSVLDKSDKKDLLDPKSDNSKAINLATVEVLYLKKGKFFKYKGYNTAKYDMNYDGRVKEFVNLEKYKQDKSLHAKKDNRPDDKNYSISLISRIDSALDRADELKEGELAHGTTIFKWSETDIDTIKTQVKRNKNENGIRLRKIWVNKTLV